MTKKEFLQIVGWWIIWRAGLVVCAILASAILPFQPTYPYSGSLLAPSGLPQWTYSWAGFDGVHYLTIAEKGYLGTGLIQAFFPALPLMIKAVNVVFPLIISGLIVGTMGSLVLCLSWFTVIKHFRGSSEAAFSLIVLLVFPTSFFLAALYTESWFVSACLWSFYFVHQRRWGLVLLMGILISSLRINGVFLIPALLLALYLHEVPVSPTESGTLLRLKTKISSFLQSYWREVLVITVGMSGLIGYMLYLHLNFQDAWYFFHVQSEFGAGREEHIILWPQVVWRYSKIILTQTHWGLNMIPIVQEAVVGIGGLLLLLWQSVKERHSKELPWVLFSLGSFLLPTLTGTFSSMPRYILMSFSIFLLLSSVLKKHSVLRWLYFLGSGMLLIINTVLFIQGYWVA